MAIFDWVSATMNDLMNCKNMEKMNTTLLHSSKVIIKILEILKKEGYIADFSVEDEKFKIVRIKLGKLNKCGSIKPRFYVKKKDYNKYIRRFLPARDFGVLIVSTNKGLMTNREAIEKELGGSLIAYCY